MITLNKAFDLDNFDRVIKNSFVNFKLFTFRKAKMQKENLSIYTWIDISLPYKYTGK